ncbi:MAG: hypothetical protein OEL53_18165 [Rhodospirillales bacterium]|nr:hypothetical protein [Rhodospirillales bacterium]
MILKEIYTALHDQHFVASQYEFSKQWLGKSRSYLSSAKARQRTPSVDVLLALSTKLNSFSSSYSKYALPFEGHTSSMLSQLRDRVWKEIMARYAQ